jgi:phage recombination protein Bet
MNEIIVKTNSGEIALNDDIVRNQISNDPGVTDQEVNQFMMLCKYRKLNPFLKEAHLIKYGKNPASIVVGKDVFTNRLNEIPEFQGREEGVIVVGPDGESKELEGTYYNDGQKLRGAYIKIWVKGWQKPYKWTIRLQDYLRTYKDKNDGWKVKPMGQWAIMPAVMLVKCATVAGIRNLFPKDFGGMYTSDEIGVDINDNNIQNSSEIYITDDDIDGLRSVANAFPININFDESLSYILKKLKEKKVINTTNIYEVSFSKFDLILKNLIELLNLAKKKQENLNKKKEDNNQDAGKETQGKESVEQNTLITKDQIAEIKKLQEEIPILDSSVKVVLKDMFKIEKMEELNTEQYKLFIDRMKKQLEKKGKKDE